MGSDIFRLTAAFRVLQNFSCIRLVIVFRKIILKGNLAQVLIHMLYHTVNFEFASLNATLMPNNKILHLDSCTKKRKYFKAVGMVVKWLFLMLVAKASAYCSYPLLPPTETRYA